MPIPATVSPHVDKARVTWMPMKSRGARDQDACRDLRTGNALQIDWRSGGRRLQRFIPGRILEMVPIAKGGSPAQSILFARDRSFPIASRKILSLPCLRLSPGAG